MALAMLNTTTQMTASDFSFVVPAEDTPAVEYDDSFLGELEIEYLEKVSQIRSLTERLALRLESSFRYELLKLPLAVRSMTMREFCEQCGGDVEQAIQHAAKRRKAATELMPPPSSIMQPPRSIARPKALRDADAPAGLRNSRRQAASMTATPMGGARATRGRTAAATPGGAGLSTPSVGVGAMPMLTPRMHETPRFARTGEVMLSANGSPINVLHTIKAKVRANAAVPLPSSRYNAPRGARGDSAELRRWLRVTAARTRAAPPVYARVCSRLAGFPCAGGQAWLDGGGGGAGDGRWHRVGSECRGHAQGPGAQRRGARRGRRPVARVASPD